MNSPALFLVRRLATVATVATVALLSGTVLDAEETLAVRVSEVGDRGHLFVDVPPRASFEIAAKEPFRGTLLVTLRAERDDGISPGLSWGDLARVPLDLAPGTTKVSASLLSTQPLLDDLGQPTKEIAWVVEDDAGRRVASGREAVRPVAAVHRVLRLTAEAGDGFRRAPGEAYETPDRYQPWSVVLVSRGDLSTLTPVQRRALFDATVLGLGLVVTHDGKGDSFAPLGAPFDDALRHERPVWRGDRGEEVRGADLLFGRVTRTNFRPPSPPGSLEDPNLVPYMLVTSGRSVVETGPALLWHLSAEDSYWRTAHAEGLRGRARSLRNAVLLVVVLSGGILGLLWWTSGNRARPSRRPALALLVLCLGSPILVYAALAGHRAGNHDARLEVTVHDDRSPAACRGTYAFRGGGGGSEPVRLSCRPPERGIVLAASETRLETTFRADGSLEVAAAEAAPAWERQSLLWTREIVPPAPVWEANLRRNGSRVEGTVRARRSVKDAWLLWRGGGSRVGALRAGAVVDVSTLEAVPEKDLWKRGLRRLETARIYWWTWLSENESPRAYWQAPHPAEACLASEESDDGGIPRFDFQALAIEERPAPDRLRVPAVQRGREIFAAIPRALAIPADAELRSASAPYLPDETFSLADSPASRIEEGSGGVRWAVFPTSRRYLDARRVQLRSDLPSGAGYLSVQVKGGTR